MRFIGNIAWFLIVTFSSSITLVIVYFVARYFEIKPLLAAIIYAVITVLFLLSAKLLTYHIQKIHYAFWGTVVGFTMSLTIVTVIDINFISWDYQEKFKIRGSNGDFYIVRLYWNDCLIVPGQHKIAVNIKKSSSIFYKRIVYFSGNRTQLVNATVKKHLSQDILLLKMKTLPMQIKFEVECFVAMDGLLKPPWIPDENRWFELHSSNNIHLGLW